MSDIESEISEEIIDDFPSDGSDLYNPLDADYDAEEPTLQHRRDTMTKLPIIQTAKATLPTVTTRDQSFATTKGSMAVTNLKNSAAPKSDESYNEYSAVFDDYENDFDEYSNEFEEEKSTVDKLPASTTPAAPTPAAVAASWFPQIPQLIQADSQALQAELALQEISKEVVRLRNQQRNLLQERRRIAREKKLRAEARRAHYQVELKSLRDRATEAEAENLSLKETVESLQRDLEISENNRTFLKSSIHSLESTVSDLNENISERQLEIDALKDKLNEEEALAKEAEKSWLNEKAVLKEEILRYKLQAELAMKNVEDNNMRLARERERLPEEYQRQVSDERKRVETLENTLKEREGALRAEEVRRLTALDVKSKEVAEEAARARMRFEVDIADERSALRAQKQEFEQEKARNDSRLMKERAEISLHMAELARREAALTEDMAVMYRARGELEASQCAVEPSLRATAADREAARVAAVSAGKLLREAEERASSVLAAERGLLRREGELQEREENLEGLRTRLISDSQVMQSEAKRLSAARKAVGAERFKLHGAAVELASQASELRQTSSILVKHQTLASALTTISSSSASLSPAQQEQRNGRGSWDYQDSDNPNPHRGYERDTLANNNNTASTAALMRHTIASSSSLPGMLTSMNILDNIQSNMQRLAEGLSEYKRPQPSSDTMLVRGAETDTRAGKRTGTNLRFVAEHFDNLSDNRPRSSRYDDDYHVSNQSQDFHSNVFGLHSSTADVPPSSADGTSPALKSSIEGASQSVQSLKMAAAKYGIF